MNVCQYRTTLFKRRFRSRSSLACCYLLDSVTYETRKLTASFQLARSQAREERQVYIFVRAETRHNPAGVSIELILAAGLNQRRKAPSRGYYESNLKLLGCRPFDRNDKCNFGGPTAATAGTGSALQLWIWFWPVLSTLPLLPAPRTLLFGLPLDGRNLRPSGR